jgi:hypothetical protein
VYKYKYPAYGGLEYELFFGNDQINLNSYKCSDEQELRGLCILLLREEHRAIINEDLSSRVNVHDCVSCKHSASTIVGKLSDLQIFLYDAPHSQVALWDV